MNEDCASHIMKNGKERNKMNRISDDKCQITPSGNFLFLQYTYFAWQNLINVSKNFASQVTGILLAIKTIGQTK